MKKKNFLLFIFFIVIHVVNGQNGGNGFIFNIDKISPNEKESTIDIFLSAHTDRKVYVGIDLKKFAVTERVDSKTKDLNIKEIEHLKDNLNQSDAVISFLFDASFSMQTSGYSRARRLIDDFLDSKILDRQKFYAGWVFEKLPNLIELKKGKESIIAIENSKPLPFIKLTKPLNALVQAVNQLEDSPIDGKKIIVLFTDGQSFKNEDEKLRQDYLYQLSKIDQNIEIYVISVGEVKNQEVLQSIVKSTPNPDDVFQHDEIPTELIRNNIQVMNTSMSNLKVAVNLNFDDSILGLEQRNFKIKYNDGRINLATTKDVVFGGASGTEDIRHPDTLELSTLGVLFYGLSFIGGMLAVFWVAIPLFNKYYFKKNHVKLFKEIKKTGVSPLDPLTLQPIQDEEQVVEMGNRVMLLDTWKYLSKNGQGETAKDHAEFFEGHIPMSFFSQRGIFQRLNWLWFGAVGGFLAWGINHLLGKISWEGYQSFLANIFDVPGKQISSSIYLQTFTGIALSIGICTGLALVDELGQSRKFNTGRIFKRIGLGVLIATPVFTLQAILTTLVLNNNYLGGIVGWTLFGTVIGFVSTLNSSIEKKNGLFGGLVAGVIAFHFYYLLQHVPQVIDLLNSDFAQMMSFIIYGGLLGFILFTVVNRLEDFELVYISPQAFNGQVKSISKWLKSSNSEEVIIGTNPKSKVYIKWGEQDKFVKDRHAQLTYEGGEVYIESIEEAEVLVNNAMIKNRKKLQDGDQIKLGIQSISLMQFNARTTSKELTAEKIQEKEIAPPAPAAVAVRVQKK